MDEILKLCRCGSIPDVYFGFSATGKPTTKIVCRNCGECVFEIVGGKVTAFDKWNARMTESEENNGR